MLGFPSSGVLACSTVLCVSPLCVVLWGMELGKLAQSWHGAYCWAVSNELFVSNPRVLGFLPASGTLGGLCAVCTL
jgi:hypothetical protein